MTPSNPSPLYLSLHPVERLTLRIAIDNALKGKTSLPNTTAVCIFALARLVGLYDQQEELRKREQEL